jgi:hypothetical protein
MRPRERRATRLVGILALVAVGVVGLLRVIAVGARTDRPRWRARRRRTPGSSPTPKVLVLRERGIDRPYPVRYVALSTTTAMPNVKNRVVQNAYVTSAYRATSFSDQEFGDPGLLDAADRVERDGLAGGLQRGG